MTRAENGKKLEAIVMKYASIINAVLAALVVSFDHENNMQLWSAVHTHPWIASTMFLALYKIVDWEIHFVPNPASGTWKHEVQLCMLLATWILALAVLSVQVTHGTNIPLLYAIFEPRM